MRCLTYWVFLLPCMPHALNKWQSADHRAAWDSQQANPHHLRAHLAADRHGGSVQVFSDFCMSDISQIYTTNPFFGAHGMISYPNEKLVAELSIILFLCI